MKKTVIHRCLPAYIEYVVKKKKVRWVSMYIRLDSVEKVKEFVNNIQSCEGEIDLISGRYEVDGKSLLGVFSLDLTKPIEVRVQKNDMSGQLEQMLCRYST